MSNNELNVNQPISIRKIEGEKIRLHTTYSNFKWGAIINSNNGHIVPLDPDMIETGYDIAYNVIGIPEKFYEDNNFSSDDDYIFIGFTEDPDRSDIYSIYPMLEFKESNETKENQYTLNIPVQHLLLDPRIFNYVADELRSKICQTLENNLWVDFRLNGKVIDADGGGLKVSLDKNREFTSNIIKDFMIFKVANTGIYDFVLRIRSADEVTPLPIGDTLSKIQGANLYDWIKDTVKEYIEKYSVVFRLVNPISKYLEYVVVNITDSSFLNGTLISHKNCMSYKDGSLGTACIKIIGGRLDE